MFCPLFALNLFILLSLLFLTHSFDLPPLTPRTHTLHIMNIHLSVCLNLSLPEFEEDSVYISVCVLTVSCIFEDEQIWQIQTKKNCCPQTKNLPALVSVYMHAHWCVCLSVYLCVCVRVWVRAGGYAVSKISEAACFLNQCASSLWMPSPMTSQCVRVQLRLLTCAPLWPKTDPISDNIPLWVASQGLVVQL